MSSWAECNFEVVDTAVLSPIIGFESFGTNSGLETASFDPFIPNLRREDASLYDASFYFEPQPSDRAHVAGGDMLGEREIANDFSIQAMHEPFESGVFPQFETDLTDPRNEKFSNALWQQSNVFIPSTPDLGPQEKISFDIGLESLDDILGHEDANQYIGSPHIGPHSPFLEQQSPFAARAEASLSFEEQLDIDNCGVSLPSIKLADLFELPSPKVLKTGFDVAKSVRGGSYDYKTSCPQRSGFGNQTYNPRWSEPRPGTRSQFSTPYRSTSSHFSSLIGDKAVMALKYKPREFESNLYRTVSFSGVATGVHLRDILARVRGGAVKSAVMTDTTAITGSKTAIVQFVMEDAAFAYVLNANKYPIVFLDEKTGAITSAPLISRVNTPTYVSPRCYSGGFGGYNQTRCISVEKFPEHIDADRLAADISFRFQFRFDTLLEFYVDVDGNLLLEFSSIEAACIAYTAISIWSRELRVRFDTDPCSRPLEDLEIPVKKRPSIAVANQTWKFMSPEEQARFLEDNSDKFKMMLRWITSRGGRRNQPSAVVESKPVPRWMPSEAKSLPCMDGTGLRGSSWADEVMDETGEDCGAVDFNPASAINGPKNLSSASKVHSVADDIKQNINNENQNRLTRRTPPVGLTASTYATATPCFPNMSGPRRRYLRDRDRSSSGIFHAATATRQQRQHSNEHNSRYSGINTYIDRVSSDKIMLSIERDNEVSDEMDGDSPGVEQSSNQNGNNQSSSGGGQNYNAENSEDDSTIHENSRSDSPSIEIDSLSGSTLVDSFASSSFPISSASSSSLHYSSSSSPPSSNPTSTSHSDNMSKTSPHHPAVFHSRCNDSSISNFLLYNATLEYMRLHSPSNHLLPIRWLCLPLRKILAERAQEKPYIPSDPTTTTTSTTTPLFINITSLPDLDRVAARSHIVWTHSGGEIRRDIAQYFTRDGCAVGDDDLVRLSAEETAVAGEFFAMRESGADDGVGLLREGFWGESDSETEELRSGEVS